MASLQKSKILVVGATGMIGKHITQELIAAKDSFAKLGVMTRPGSSTGEKAEMLGRWEKEHGVEIQRADPKDEAAVTKAFEGYDTIVSTFGRSALDAQIPLLRLADQIPHIKRFIPSEYGTDIEYNASSANEPTHQVKLKVRKFIREDIKNLSGFYLVTGPYAEMWLDSGIGGKAAKAGGWDVNAKKAIIPGSSDGKISFTCMKDVGRLLVAALLHPKLGNGPDYRPLIVNSFTTTPGQVLSEFERQTGAKWTSEVTPLDDLKALEKSLYEEKDPIAARVTLRRIWAEGGTLYEKTDTEELGLKNPESLQDVVRATIKAQSEGRTSAA